MVGTLVGLEIPLVMRISEAQRGAEGPGVAGADVRLLGRAGGVAGVSAAAGAATGADSHRAAVWPARTPAVALWALWLFRDELRRLAAYAVACALVLAALLAGVVGRRPHHHPGRGHFYQDRIVFAAASPYQRIVVTHRARPGTGCFSTATCSLPSATNTATTRRWYTRPWRRTVRPNGGRAGRRRRHGGARDARSTPRSNR